MADPGFEVDDLANVKSALTQMYHIAHTAYEIKDYVREQVACDTGFMGLMSPFRDAMSELREAAENMTGTFGSRYGAVAEALRQAGFEYDLVDGQVSDLFVRTGYKD